MSLPSLTFDSDKMLNSDIQPARSWTVFLIMSDTRELLISRGHRYCSSSLLLYNTCIPELRIPQKGFYSILYNEETGYWRREAQRVFKTPHVDSLINKVPWRYLFQGMAKAHVYTWGQGADGRLGHDRPLPDNYRRSRYSVAIPFEILRLRDKFVVDIVGG